MIWKLFGIRLTLKLMRFWPPLFGAGIRVSEVNKDISRLKISMPLRFYNSNVVGVHFGGSLYSMCDPFYMLILMLHLGNDYIVWDKAAEVQFVKPGRKRVHAIFEIPTEKISEIRQIADRGEKYLPVFKVEVLDDDGQIIAIIRKTLYVKKKL